jgi:hypothetical protein
MHILKQDAVSAGPDFIKEVGILHGPTHERTPTERSAYSIPGQKLVLRLHFPH